MQGPHQVAQKSTTTTLPFRESRLTRPPLRSGRSNGGAALASFDFGAGPQAATARPATTATRALRHFI